MKLSILSYIAFLFLGVVVSGQALSTEHSRADLDITRLTLIGKERPTRPGSGDIVRIYFENASWGNSNCRGDAADLNPEDDKIYSLVLAAYLANRQLRQVIVEDTIRPLDTVCQLTSVQL